MPCPRKVVPLRRADPHADAAALDGRGDASPTEPGGPQPAPASLWHAHCFAPPMPPAELHLRAIERGVVSEGGLLAYGRERAGESALLSAGRRRALREKGGMTVSAQRASGGPTGYPPAGDQPCAARCGRALIGGAPARRCTRLPLCQPRQRAGGAQSRSEETAGSQGAARARRKTDGKWPPHAASAEAACGGHILALPATGPFSVRCTTASLKRAPAGSGRSRDGLKLRPQLLGGVRMAGLERLLARYPHPDAAAKAVLVFSRPFDERRRGVGTSR